MAERWTKTKTGIKTSISMPERVSEWAEELMEARGFDNFSAFVADLIRREKERQDEKVRTENFPRNDALTEPFKLNEGPPPKKPKRPPGPSDQ